MDHAPNLADLRAGLPELMLRDQRRLRRRLDRARRVHDADGRQQVTDELLAEVEAARARVRARRASVPPLRYPPELPVSQRRDDLLAAIRDHQVVIVAGETGSGKTTQLPKICLELGRGVLGLVGHTQPRRLAARTVADRIAEELGTPLGATVGYKVRFTDQVGPDALVKLMTDGILLAEVQTDRELHQYDTLIIDEAHERSLNIDFLLGYVKRLLPRRPELKVVITSATIDPDRFSRHFDGAPVVEVSGRTYPVEVRYRPLVQPAEPAGADAEPARDTVRDQVEAISDAVRELSAEAPGDILVFLSGEREIRDTADALRRLKLRAHGAEVEILPLYARLSVAEQHRVFAPHGGRRIVLATNVAETSLTVPGIKYVIDPGTARISRYSHRLKVQRLPIEPISQASANQRKGRCGRTSDGICIRLYDEVDFAGRPAFTEPEIVRTNLASVILRMAAAGLGDIAEFPFIDPPDRRHIADGVTLLHELGALDGGRLTPLGRRLAQLPVDPRLGRMVLAAEATDCVREVLVLAAALSIQDPRERPTDQQQAADQQHARFAHEDSDFLGFLALWDYLRERQRELSSSQFRRMCRTEFLNYLRVREWQDLHAQLREIAGTIGVRPGRAAAEPDQVHTALLAGLLSHIGLKEGPRHEYVGARGAKFAIFPGSALFRKQPQWVMAAELVETSRLWARTNARIQPEWVEPLAGHLVKRQYSEPHWSRRQAAVLAHERVTLYGVPIVADRLVPYGRIDPPLARELFIRHALVEGDWDTPHAFFHANRELLAEVQELEHRSRRRDIVVDDEALYAFYDQRVGAEVVSGRHFDRWWKQTRRSHPELLTFEKAMLVNPGTGQVSRHDYPDEWRQDGLKLPLTYQFEPGTDADGVTVHIPLPLLLQVRPEQFEWQVPGLRHDLVVALIRSLPKALRRSFVPAPDFAAAVLDRVSPADGRLLDALGHELGRLAGAPLDPRSWQPEAVPPHLRMTFRVEDGDRVLAEGKDLAALQRALAPRLRATVAEAADGLTRTGLRDWDLDVLPRTVEQVRAGYRVTAYPALVDEGDSVGVRAFDSPTEQRYAMWRGTRRLLRLRSPAPAALVEGRLDNQTKLALLRNPHRNAADLLQDCVDCALDRLIGEHGGPAWDAAGFARLHQRVRADLVDAVLGVLSTVREILVAAHAIEQRLAVTPVDPTTAASILDIRGQLAGLVYRGFVTATGARRLADLPRYLRAIERRLDRLPQHPARDRQHVETMTALRREYDRLAQGRGPSADLLEIRWMLEELRVNLFAQAVGTAYPVSEKRVRRALDALAT